MAGSINKAILLGKCVSEPRSHQFSNGDKVCTFKLETTRSWSDKESGERKTWRETHNIAIRSDALITTIQRDLREGQQAYVEGKVQTRSYEKDGQKRWITEVVVSPYSGDVHCL